MSKRRLSHICFSASWLLLLLTVAGCRHEVVIYNSETEQQGTAQYDAVAGFYLLCEGNMGSNKATLDYYDFLNATYHRNIYSEINPYVAKELGDVGNDLRIYGSRMYAVINCSNKIEVLDARTCIRIGQIDVPNCRYLCFSGGYGYVTSYAGPVSLNDHYEQIGYVARFDTATLQIIDRCLVGFQPDGIAVAEGKLYVANSGGYMVPNYENTLSVIDLATFTEQYRIPVAINLNRVCADSHGQLWVSSRGDYYGHPSRLYCVDTATDVVIDSVETSVSDFWLDGDSLYLYSEPWSYLGETFAASYCIVDVRTHRVVKSNFITDGTDRIIKKPYGVSVHPLTKQIYVTDAKDYVTPGTLYCFSRQGTLLWSVRTGDIPAHVAFLWR